MHAYYVMSHILYICVYIYITFDMYTYIHYFFNEV